MEPAEDGEPLNDRHYWVLSQLAQGVKLTKHHVIAQYAFSERSAKRVLSALTKRGLIEFCPEPRPGLYRLCDPELLKDIQLKLASEAVENEGDDAPGLGTCGRESPCNNGTLTAQ